MIIYVLLENSSARILECSNHIVPAQFTKEKVEEKKLQMLVGRCRKRRHIITWGGKPGTSAGLMGGVLKAFCVAERGGTGDELNLFTGIVNCSYKAILFRGGALGPIRIVSATCNLGNKAGPACCCCCCLLPSTLASIGAFILLLLF
jgi:hypothetical protein